METFGCFKYKLFRQKGGKRWAYQIFDHDNTMLCEPKETYAYEGIARLAVIGHITLLEQKDKGIRSNAL